jgi:ABC-type multidrug transport system fused ATPase/permease subunit
MRTAERENAGAHSTAGARTRVAIALLIRPQRLRLVLLTAARVVVGFFDLALAAATYILFLLLQGLAPAHRHSWLPNSILAVAAAAGLLVVVRVLADILSAHAVFRQIQDLAADFMFRLTRGYCEMQWTRFIELNRSELTSITAHTTREAADFYHRCVEMIAGAVIVIAMTAAFVYQSPAAAACFAAALATLYCTHRLIVRKRVQNAASMREKSLGRLQRHLSGLFSSGKEIRTYGNQEFFYDRIRSETGQFAVGSRRSLFLPQAARIIADQGTVLLFLGLIVVVQLQRGDTHRLLSLLAFYFVLSRRLLPLVSQLSLIAGQMESSFENVSIVDAELKRCRLHRAVPSPAANPAAGLALQLEQVSFAFSDGPLILDNVSLLLREGEIAVLSGASGIGKTSLLNIISGVLPRASGSVCVDRADLTYVPQEIVLLDDTIRNNLLFGLPRADDRKLMKALAVARLDDFVAALPRGLDSGVGDNGALFSGGERQRFGVARAAVRGSRLMLLDEATSALDKDNERQVLNNLAATGAAILLVTHRQHTHRWAHHVYRLERGRLLEVRRSAAPPIVNFVAAMLERA